jgi:hypothetical protein
MATESKPPTLSDSEVLTELLNDSLGTIDPADTTDTDPNDDPIGDKGIGTRENA